MIAYLDEATPFPDPDLALADPNGLLAIGANLSPERLIMAYREGIFPWFSAGEPILWWSPDPRMVLFPDEFAPSRSLAKTLRQGHFEIRIDSAFEEVIRQCAAPRATQRGTWITKPMQDAYGQLFRAGHAHSVEVWQDNVLVGGLYGLLIGAVFCGESMFSRVTDASKVAFAHLVAIARQRGLELIDCQMHTPHLASLGARTVPRRIFLDILRAHRDRRLAFHL